MCPVDVSLYSDGPTGESLSSKECRVKYSRVRGFVIGLMAGVLLSTQATAAVFLKIGAIKGESTWVGHEDEIDLVSFSFDAFLRDPQVPGTGCIDGLIALKETDLSSPNLAFHTVTGQLFPTAVVSATTTTPSGSVDYLVLSLKNVRIKNFESSVSADTGRGSESLLLGFEELVMKYTPINADGSTGNPYARKIIVDPNCY